MKILVAGSGFTGCTFARMFKDEGHHVEIIEKKQHIGGLSYTKTSPNGFLYEPYGSRVFHTRFENIKEFVTRFSMFNSYVHKKGVIIRDKLYHFPISYKQIEKMPERDKIFRELSLRPPRPDITNFESYMISQFGYTLYRLFIYNYSKKMWGMEPGSLKVKWSMKRVELKQDDKDTFSGEWQGLPVNGYTEFFKNMVKDIPLKYGQHDFNAENYDYVIFTGKIDELNNYKYGRLPYRSMEYDYSSEDSWDCDSYGTINLPDHDPYIRKSNYRVLYQVDSGENWIQYQKPVEHDEENVPMYPVVTDKNIDKFKKYLYLTCTRENIIPAGRLGLYNYLNMDSAVKLAMDMKGLVEKWKSFSAEERSEYIIRLIDW